MFQMGMRKAMAFGLLAALCALLFTLAAPPDAGAEPTIGIILTRGNPFFEESHKALMSHLREYGMLDRTQVILQRPNADPVAWANATRKLIAADVSVIVTFGLPATLAALKEKPRIPVIYSGVVSANDKELEGRKVTGVCSRPSVPTLFRYVNSAAQNKRMGVLFSTFETDSARQAAEIIELAGKYGFVTIPLELRKPADISSVLSGFDEGFLMITSSSVLSSSWQSIERNISGKNVPTASLQDVGERYPTILLTPKAESHGMIAAQMLSRIMKGESPSSIAREYISDVEIVFNLREANDLGLKIPLDLVTEATRLLQ